MTSTTREHADELEARRQKRQGIAAASEPPGPKPAEAARELWRDIVAYGPASSPSSPTAHAAEDDGTKATSAISPTAEEPGSRRGSEGVEELVRRVQAGSQTRGNESSAIRRRPTGTADLPDRTAPSRRQIRTHSRASTAQTRRRKIIAAAAVLVAGIVLIAAASEIGGQRSARADHPATSTAARTGTLVSLVGELPTMISAIQRELRGVATRAAASSAQARRRAAKQRRRSLPHAASEQQRTPRGAAQVGQTTASTTTSAPHQTYTPAASRVSRPSQSTAATTPSHSSSSQPAGSTNAGPLGGIGSCVKGC